MIADSDKAAPTLIDCSRLFPLPIVKAVAFTEEIENFGFTSLHPNWNTKLKYSEYQIAGHEGNL